MRWELIYISDKGITTYAFAVAMAYLIPYYYQFHDECFEVPFYLN